MITYKNIQFHVDEKNRTCTMEWMSEDHFSNPTTVNEPLPKGLLRPFFNDLKPFFPP